MDNLSTTILILSLFVLTISSNQVKHVIHFGIDGLNPLCIWNSSNGGFNILRRLGRQASGTLVNARTAIETISAPGWTAILTSMTSVLSGIHDNNWIPPWSPFNGQPSIMPVCEHLPTIFKIIKDNDRSYQTTFFYNWKWLSYLASIPNSLDLNCDLSSFSTNTTESDSEIQKNALDFFKNRLNINQTSYSFIYFHSVDFSGHKYGWCSEEYEEAVGYVDILIGEILDQLEKLDVLTVLSADHGGRPGDFNHGYQNDDCLRVPLLFKGKGIKREHHISEVVRNIDIAPTIAHWMNISYPEDLWEGKPLLSIFTD